MIRFPTIDVKYENLQSRVLYTNDILIEFWIIHTSTVWSQTKSQNRFKINFIHFRKPYEFCIQYDWLYRRHKYGPKIKSYASQLVFVHVQNWIEIGNTQYTPYTRWKGFIRILPEKILNISSFSYRSEK